MPPTHMYYQISCGDSLPSYFCVKRDGFVNEKGRKVDIGYNELIYRLPLLSPPYSYCIWAITSAPKPTRLTFSFQDTVISTSLTPAKPETLFYFFKPQESCNGSIELKITGSDGAYLENLRVYQVVVAKDFPCKPQGKGISASNFSTDLFNLTVVPNPLRKSATIRYSIPQAGKVELAVFDVTGRMIVGLINREEDAGNYILNWNSAGLPDGIYFIRLKTKAYTTTNKLLILR